MKKFIKISAILFVIIMTVALMTTVSYAANPDTVTILAEIDTPEIEYSETEDQEVTVTIFVEEGPVEICAISGTVLEYKNFTTSVSHDEYDYSTSYNAKRGKFGWDCLDDEDYVEIQDLLQITYVIPAGTAIGEYELGIEKLMLTYDGGFATLVSSVTASTTLTIKEPAPACCDETNPHAIIELPYKQYLNDEDHFYTWTATKDGTITFTTTSIDGNPALDIIVYKRLSQILSRMPKDASTFAVDVKAGDVFIINAYTSAGAGTWTAKFTCTHHSNVKCDSNYDGSTHNIVCDDCGIIVEENVPCSGGEAKCDDLPWCEFCGDQYGEYAEHTGGKATCKDLAVCKVCGNKYGELSSEHTGEKIFILDSSNSFEHEICCSHCSLPWEMDPETGMPLSEPHKVVNGKCAACGAFVFALDFNGGKLNQTSPFPDMYDDVEWKAMLEETIGSLDATVVTDFSDEEFDYPVYPEEFAYWNLMVVRDGYKLVGYAYDAEGKYLYKGEDITGPTTLYFVWECTHDEDVHEYIYSYNGGYSLTHTVKCECGAIVEENVACTDVTNDKDHNCDKCGETIGYCGDYGLVEIPGQDPICKEGKAGWCAYSKCDCGQYLDGYNIIGDEEALKLWKAEGGAGYLPPNHAPSLYIYPDCHEPLCCVCLTLLGDPEPHNFKTDDYTCVCGLECPHVSWGYGKDNGDGTHALYCGDCDKFTHNAPHTYNPSHTCQACEVGRTGWYEDCYYVNAVLQKTGWTEIGDAWYYLDPETGKRAEGITRVPYAPDYAPNIEDVKYAEANGTTFIDLEKIWCVFDENGVFQSDLTGIVEGKYVEDGMIWWHPGFVTVAGKLYYFVGDAVNGGNKAADGIVYVTRGTGDKTFKPGYIFFNKGQVDTTKDEYIAEIKGSLFYFEDGVCLTGKGLMKLDGGKYIYIRSGGQLAIGVYYVGDCKYEFDENGYSTGLKNGIIDGMYYVDGHVAYGAGLVEIAEGKYIYVRSSGELVMDDYYYVTNVNDTGIEKGTKVYFDENGIMEEIKNGVVEDGMYYVNNRVQYGAGVVKMTDENGKTFYIYVRSNGQLATGKYWPTTLNGELPYGEYDWGKDGKYYPAK